MSFCTSQKSWPSLVKALYLFLFLALLAGCSSFGSKSKDDQRDEKLEAIIFGGGTEETLEVDVSPPVQGEGEPTLEGVAPVTVESEPGGIEEPLTSSEEGGIVPLFQSDAELAAAGPLQYWEMISGGSASQNRFLDTVAGDRSIKFVRPVAVCVRGDLVYVVDMGLSAVFRYHRVTGEIERVLDLLDIVSGDVADIYVNKDLSFYITDTFGSRVLRFTHNGKLQQIFKNRLNLVRPVGVIEDDITGSVLVADAEYDHVLVFNQEGDPYTTLGRRGEDPGQFLNITAMAMARDEIYISSRVGGKVQVISREGEYLYSLEQDVMRFPLSLVVGGSRVYSSDYMDNTIKIFERGKLVQSFGGTGIVPGRFKRITDLWIEEGFLYAVDSLNAHIQVMKIADNFIPAEPVLGQ